MVNKLIEARRWAEGIRDCLHKAENWSSLPGSDSEKVHLDCVNELLGFDPLPCNEPGHLILQVVMLYRKLYFISVASQMYDQEFARKRYHFFYHQDIYL